MGQMKCISDVVTKYAFQITRPSVIDDVAAILEEVEVKRRHHKLLQNSPVVDQRLLVFPFQSSMLSN